MRVYLGLDQGSSSTKAILLGENGDILWRDAISITTRNISDSEVEQDAEEILATCKEIVRRAEDISASKNFEVKGIGLAVQRSSTLSWDFQNLRVYSPVLSWRDTRMSSSKIWKSLNTERESIYRKTGMMLSPGYAGIKLHYLQNQYPSKVAYTSTLEAYLAYALCQPEGNQFRSTVSCEESMAHRSLLYSMTTRNWDKDLCQKFEVDSTRLPRVKPSLSNWGFCSTAPLRAVLGDQQAALLSLYFSDNNYKSLLNLGTIGSFLCLTKDRRDRPDRFLQSILFSSELDIDAKHQVHFLNEGTTNACGYTLSSSLALMPELKNNSHNESTLTSDDLIAFCPFAELTTPTWAGRSIDCILPGKTRADRSLLAKALLESLGNFLLDIILPFLNVKDVLDPEVPLAVTGGGSASNYLLQYISDCSGLALGRVAFSDSTAIGAALAASRSEQKIPTYALHFERIFRPENTKRKETRYYAWKRLQEKVLASDTSATIPLSEFNVD